MEYIGFNRGIAEIFVRNIRGIYGSFPILVPISKRIIRGLYGNYPPAFLCVPIILWVSIRFWFGVSEEFIGSALVTKWKIAGE